MHLEAATLLSLVHATVFLYLWNVGLPGSHPNPSLQMGTIAILRASWDVTVSRGQVSCVLLLIH